MSFRLSRVSAAVSCLSKRAAKLWRESGRLSLLHRRSRTKTHCAPHNNNSTETKETDTRHGGAPQAADSAAKTP